MNVRRERWFLFILGLNVAVFLLLQIFAPSLITCGYFAFGSIVILDTAELILKTNKRNVWTHVGFFFLFATCWPALVAAKAIGIQEPEKK